MSSGDRRLAAVMFTDVVGFTTMGQRNEALALRLLEEQRGVVRPVIAKFRGTEVKTIGDAFLVEFSSALEAVQCAIEIQQKMHDRNSMKPADQQVQLRIGVHVGDVVHSQGDILGDAVNVSSRIEPIAEPGGVCLSGQVYDNVRNKVDTPMELLEPKRLKNVVLPVAVYKVVLPWEEKAELERVVLDKRRVAVLPLKNMSPDPNDEYFADGMTEELITALSSVTELTVIARTSVMQYKQAPKRISDIGKELGAGTLIEGSVRKAGTKVRITVQMVDAANEGHLWAQNYDKQLDDVFTVQSEVAEKVAEALKVKLAGEEKRRIEKGPTSDPEAYNLYLQGLFYWNKRTLEGMNKASELFKRATAKDPGFALGFAGLALTHFITAANTYDNPEVHYPLAKEYALKAMSLDPGLAEPHAVMGAVHSGFYFDLDAAEAEFKKAIELNPSYASAHQWYAQYLEALDRKDEAWKEISKALELNPLSLIINTNVADAHYWQGEFDKGVEQAKKVIEMDPSFATAYRTLIINLVMAGRLGEAKAELKTYAKIGEPLDVMDTEATIYSYEGKAPETRKVVEKMLSDGAGKVSPTLAAMSYFKIGDVDKGFEMLELSVKRKDRYALFLPIFYEVAPFRSDPRYASVIERMGLSGKIKG